MLAYRTRPIDIGSAIDVVSDSFNRTIVITTIGRLKNKISRKIISQ